MFKALKEGDELMNAGRLKQALPYYEKVMQAADFKVPFCGIDIMYVDITGCIIADFGLW
jgi:hypothetical protein